MYKEKAHDGAETVRLKKSQNLKIFFCCQSLEQNSFVYDWVTESLGFSSGS